MPSNLAIWSIPRSIDIEGAFQARDDAELASGYLNSGITNEYEAIEALQRHIDGAANCTKSVYVAKEITSNAPLANYPPINEKMDELISKFEHVILVHDPLESAVSIKTETESCSIEDDDRGFEQAYDLKNRIAKVTGKMPMVIDASTDLTNDLNKTLFKMCSHAGIPYEQVMSSWFKGSSVSRVLARLRGWSEDNLVALEERERSHQSFSYPKADFRKDESVVKFAVAYQPYYKAILSRNLVALPQSSTGWAPNVAVLGFTALLNMGLVYSAFLTASN
mmetsp:Transcript_21229/g.39881  ORF Transcript_21229/g.39881 Transcript_21229/m.39881 type:complete len:279 (+) Transcript_21229:33-869(+)|eukprot:CAMPEP_0182490822 /NCGR_PEP_ID=MMETSP1321-20130603/539_1 /TAXON_ID=91990 /ORGANISM="Bolidomonas sp., Strain RCC1657" /LENGTH=278 /DNA_ID=CAMNT_0024693061 /DNA_START=26 /DNA_END=862 /DNA_ORIENTATION=+